MLAGGSRTPFLTTALLLGMPDKAARELAAKVVFHTFVIGVYFFPLLGGWLADRYFGKYHTIGNIWVVLANHGVKGAWITEHIRETGISVAAFLMFFFAAFAFAAAIVFRVYARRYKMTDHYRA